MTSESNVKSSSALNFRRVKDGLLLASLALSVFLLGRMSVGEGQLEARSSAPLAASAPRIALPQGRSTKRGSTKASIPLVFESGTGSGASSANGLLAVTGSYGVGTSVLYLVDTERRQLAVYEARGGSTNSRKLTLVGARRIDLDLQLEGYNDESEFTYAALRAKFDAAEGPREASPAATGVDESKKTSR